jgi:hypothetical protein
MMQDLEVEPDKLYSIYSILDIYFRKMCIRFYLLKCVSARTVHKFKFFWLF